jgi:hypothetical protein
MTALLSGLSAKVWLTVIAGLTAWGVLAPLGTWGWMRATAAIDRSQAVAATRRDEQQQCRERIADVRREINDAADTRVAEALDAASRLEPTPIDAGELGRLCQSDEQCRGRAR